MGRGYVWTKGEGSDSFKDNEVELREDQILDERFDLSRRNSLYLFKCPMIILKSGHVVWVTVSVSPFK